MKTNLLSNIRTKLSHYRPIAARQPVGAAAHGAALSREELRSMIAEMID